ncbi:hypothetical protein ACEOWJ_004924 [Bacillus cereus]
MAKVFHPIESIFVPATTGEKAHPANTEYKVSYGTEIWEGVAVEVYKTQMVYDGKVSGRRSPSYPNAKDYLAVHEAMQQLIEKHGK